MATRHFGQPVRRNEDPRLLTGRGTYVDDVHLPGMLHAAILRSPHAHARIRRIDTRRAQALPGVHLVWTNQDLGPLAGPLPLLIPHPALRAKTQYALAPGIVRHVGEPVALVVAESRYLAEDALELIEVEYEPLPAVVDLEEAVRPGAPVIYPDLGDNIAAHYVQEVGNFQEAIRQAPHVLRARFSLERGAASPLETRGVVARFDPQDGSLTVWDSTQAPIPIRNGLAEMLGLPQQRVRVVAPDVGGGFGPKVMMFYPEEVLIPLAAMRLGRPVKWIEDRKEHFVATNHERLQIHDVEVGFDDEGRILALQTVFLHDCGAFAAYGLIIPIVAECTLPGPYKIPNYRAEFKAVYTNKTQTSPYRGAGRPHGVFVMERVIKRIAEHLGLDPNEVRRRNFIQPGEFPYDVGLIYQDNAPLVYDSGNYPAVLEKCLEMIGYDRWPEVRERYRAEGRYVGLGVAFYVEGTGIGPYEGARVTVEPTGKVFVATGVGTQGQSHATTFAQIVADQLGVDPADVTVVTGDTALFGWGTGTFASRGAVVAVNACYNAAVKVREKTLQVAAGLLEARPEDLELAGGMVRVKGAPQRAVSLGQVARAANPLRGTIPEEWEGPGLEASGYFAPPRGTFAAGCHAAIVEVDPETGMVRFLRYVVVHDCGRVINPLVLDGQIHGGVAQGIGGCFYERLVYDEHGQLLNASFMDYLLPTATEIPPIETAHIETPSPLNPLGIKGAGEAGVIPVPALFADAIEDALAPFRIRVDHMPIDPNWLAERIREARGRVQEAG